MIEGLKLRVEKYLLFTYLLYSSKKRMQSHEKTNIKYTNNDSNVDFMEAVFDNDTNWNIDNFRM